MPRYDFVLDMNLPKYANVTDKQIPEIILRKMTIGRVKADKPCIIFLAGGSGEGKTMTAARFAEVLTRGEVDETFLDNQIIYTPYEYTKKLRWILFNKDSGKRNILIFMEARELIKSKLWFTLINQAISDVNALSRQIKPLIFILMSQDIGDIEKDVRKTINFFGICNRPGRKRTKLSYYRISKSQLIEKPKMIQKRLKGLIRKKGSNDWEKIIVRNFVMNLPGKDTMDKLKERDFKAKSEIIIGKLDAMDRVLDKEIPKALRIDRLVETVTKDTRILNLILLRGKKGSVKVKKDFQTVYNLKPDEFKDFEKKLLHRLFEMGLLSKPEEIKADALDTEDKSEGEPEPESENDV